jgi:Tol biopolymer transport system component
VRGMRPTIAIALVSLLVVLALGNNPAPGASFPGANGRIAYASNQDGNWDIYSMNADGSDKVRLTSGPGDSTQPSFSADGHLIAFASNRAGNYDIYTMNADGSGVTRLTTDPGVDTQPTFSPDGSQIAFLGKREASWYGHVYLMNADGSNQTRLIAQFGSEDRPTFSPNGQQIAFGRIEQKHRHIFTMNTAGGELTVLTQGAFDDRQPTFSPNGQRIAFASSREGHSAIFTMRAAGGGVTKLTTGLPSQMPAYAPDGTQIAFARGGSVYTVNANGGDEVRLTKQHGTQAWPSWQPLPGGSPGGGSGGGASSFRIGKPILDRRHGTAKLPVTIPAAGTLTLRGAKIKRLAARSVASAGTVKLWVKPKSGLAKMLDQKSSAKIKVLVRYSPKSGGVEIKTKAFKLQKKRHR